MELVLEYLETVQWEDLIFSTLRILLILVLAWIIMSVVRSALARMQRRLVESGRSQGDIPSEASKRADTLVRLLRQAVMIVVWVMALLVILNEMGVSVAPILASAGVLGLAVGFGAQNLVRDVISGFFFILENQIRVGDVVVVNGTGGLVDAINFRTLVLCDLEGKVHVFPNGTIDAVTNLTRDWSAYVFDIGVAYKEDTDKVAGILREVGREMQADPEYGASIIEEPEIFGGTGLMIPP